MKCKFCDQPASSVTQPPMCERHLDLAVLTEHLADQGKPVTVETVTALFEKCQARNGVLSITVEEIPALLAGPNASSYRVTAQEA